MAAGQFVFPVVIAAFLAFFGGWIVSTPATEPNIGADRTLAIRPGDTVTFEVTAFYGEPGQGFVIYSTQEERHATLPRGKVTPELRRDPLVVEIPSDVRAGDGTLLSHLLGHRAGDRFTTPKIAPSADTFGEWQGERTIPRLLATIPTTVRYDSTTQIEDQRFNTSDYIEAWRERGFDLEQGTEFPCEGESLWPCRIVRLEREANVLEYRRVVAAGQAYPIRGLLGEQQLTGDADWNFTVEPDAAGQNVQLRLAPPAGTRFQFRVPLTPNHPVGTYEVLRTDETSLHVNHTSVYNAIAALIGRETHYDIVIVRVERPQETSAP